MKLGDKHLLSDDKAILLRGDWLNDKHMAIAQELLKKQYPHIHGLQDSILQIGRMFDAHKDQPFVQCLNLGGMHWLTVSTVGCPSGTVKVYDSLHMRLSSSVIKVIAALMHTKEKKISFQYSRMQYQAGGSDCGLFAIATACSICCGEEPEELRYNQSKMREHLRACFEAEKIIPFPSNRRRVPAQNKSRDVDQVPVYCVCRLPHDDRQMVQCTQCEDWYHTDCVRVPQDFISQKTKPWYCSFC